MKPSPEPSRSKLWRPTIHATALALLAACFVIVANNGALFHALSQRLEVISSQGALFVVTVYLTLTTVLTILFFLVGHPYTLKPAIIFFLLLGSVLSYFSGQLGVVFDVDMIRNVAETIRDNNRQEAFELLSPSLVLHVVLFGLIPALLIAWVEPVYKSPLRESLWRLGYSVALLVTVGLAFWGNYKFSTFFVRENRDVRVYAIPSYPIYALNKYVRQSSKGGDRPYQQIGNDAIQVGNSARRTVGIVVIGETARADHFSLNGYPRPTNEVLAREDVLNFPNVSAAGTSTAYSVPAMFSFLNPSDYSPEKAATQSNVLDVLQKAGVRVVWIENNSSSKGVALRVETIDLRKAPDASAPLYSDGGYFDEALEDYLDQCIDAAREDTVIVLHTMGSHGPTYHKRYPEDFARFQPDCQGDSPQECDTEAVVNAYDNTILYTDFVLGNLIEHLRQREDEFDAFLLYASDHGESLGEEGIYLHGLPAFLAPDAQTHVPMVAWFSDGAAKEFATPPVPELPYLENPFSHHNLPHTLLGLLDIQTGLYREDLDIFAPFRKSPSLPSDIAENTEQPITSPPASTS